MFEQLLYGLGVAVQPSNIFYCFIGVTLGNLVGVLPGIGSLTTIALLLPITFYIEPTSAVVMLAGVYYGGAYGGSIASILLNLPGSPSSAVACIDGYPMARQGRAGVALLMTTLASFGGASIGILFMILLAPQIANLALNFGPTEYFAIMLLGLLAASTLSIGSPVKGVAMVLMGALIGVIGTDITTGRQRFTFGITELFDGVSTVIVAMGIFGIAEVIASAAQSEEGTLFQKKVTFRSMLPTRDDVNRSLKSGFRGTLLGSFFGALPGVGATIASFSAYAVERNIASDKSRFGRGAIEGVVAPEAANNACDQTAFIPTMSLGIPGSAVMALMITALTIHGIAPGPTMMTRHPEVFWGLVMSFWVGNLLLLILNIPMIGVWVRLLLIPYKVLFPAILVFVCIGAYTVNTSVFELGLLVVFGLLGYLMRWLDFPAAPMLLGLILGPYVEEHMRRALTISQGDFSVFIERPISATVLAATALLVISVIYFSIRRKVRGEPVPAAAEDE